MRREAGVRGVGGDHAETRRPKDCQPSLIVVLMLIGSAIQFGGCSIVNHSAIRADMTDEQIRGVLQERVGGFDNWTDRAEAAAACIDWQYPYGSSHRLRWDDSTVPVDQGRNELILPLLKGKRKLVGPMFGLKPLEEPVVVVVAFTEQGDVSTVLRRPLDFERRYNPTGGRAKAMAYNRGMGDWLREIDPTAPSSVTIGSLGVYLSPGRPRQVTDIGRYLVGIVYVYEGDPEAMPTITFDPPVEGAVIDVRAIGSHPTHGGHAYLVEPFEGHRWTPRTEAIFAVRILLPKHRGVTMTITAPVRADAGTGPSGAQDASADQPAGATP